MFQVLSQTISYMDCFDCEIVVVLVLRKLFPYHPGKGGRMSQRFLVGRFSLYKVCLVKCRRRHLACARRLFVGILRKLVNTFFCVGGVGGSVLLWYWKLCFVVVIWDVGFHILAFVLCFQRMLLCWFYHCAHRVGKMWRIKTNRKPTEATHASRVGKIRKQLVSVGTRRQIKTNSPRVGKHRNGVGKA